MSLPDWNVFVGLITFGIGLLFSVAPDRAAEIWGRRNLAAVANGAIYRRLYRLAGVLLCAAGLLLVIDSFQSVAGPNWFVYRPSSRKA